MVKSYDYKNNPAFREFCIEYVSKHKRSRIVRLFNDVVIKGVPITSVAVKFGMQISDVESTVNGLYEKLLLDLRNSPSEDCVRSLNLSNATANILNRAGIYTITQLRNKIESDNSLSSIRGLGFVRTAEIFKSLGMDIPTVSKETRNCYVIYNTESDKYLTEISWGSFEEAKLFTFKTIADGVASGSSELKVKTCKIILSKNEC